MEPFGTVTAEASTPHSYVNVGGMLFIVQKALALLLNPGIELSRGLRVGITTAAQDFLPPGAQEIYVEDGSLRKPRW